MDDNEQTKAAFKFRLKAFEKALAEKCRRTEEEEQTDSQDTEFPDKEILRKQFERNTGCGG